MDSLLAPVLASSSRTQCRLARALRRLCGHWGVHGCLHEVDLEPLPAGCRLRRLPEMAEGKVSFGSRTLRAVHPSISIHLHPSPSISIHPSIHPCTHWPSPHFGENAF